MKTTASLALLTLAMSAVMGAPLSAEHNARGEINGIPVADQGPEQSNPFDDLLQKVENLFRRSDEQLYERQLKVSAPIVVQPPESVPEEILDKIKNLFQRDIPGAQDFGPEQGPEGLVPTILDKIENLFKRDFMLDERQVTGIDLTPGHIEAFGPATAPTLPVHLAPGLEIFNDRSYEERLDERQVTGINLTPGHIEAFGPATAPTLPVHLAPGLEIFNDRSYEERDIIVNGRPLHFGPGLELPPPGFAIGKRQAAGLP